MHRRNPQLVLAIILALCACAVGANAQVELRGGGCTVPPGGTPGIMDLEGQEPTLGNLKFKLSYTCPATSDSMFIVYGRCATGPDLPLFPASPCGTGCVQHIDPGSIMVAGLKIDSPGEAAHHDFGIPDIPMIEGIEICVHFLCFNTEGPKALCQEISQASSVTFTVSP